MFRKVLAAVAIAGAALTTATPAAAATAGVTSTTVGARSGSVGVAVPGDSSAPRAAGLVDYALRNYVCHPDFVGVGSWQQEYDRSGVVQFGTRYQLQARNGAGRWVNVRGGGWSKTTAFFPNDLRDFYVYWPAGPSTYRKYTPTYVGTYRIAVTHKFRTANGVWNIARQFTPACRIV